MNMDNKQRKKEMISAYKTREMVGGVCILKNTKNNKVLLDATTDIQGSLNRFQFAKMTDSILYSSAAEDWKTFGKDAFTYEVLEEITKEEVQTHQDFRKEVTLLKEMLQAELLEQGYTFY